MYDTILFDLDGTLTNPKEGILNSLMYALNKMGITNYKDKNLKEFIGPPLQVGFKTLFRFNDLETKRAVEQFREYYGEKGVYENEPYPGAVEMLADLSALGKRLFIVTSKLEKFARVIVDHYEFSPYLEDVMGADYGGKLATKTLLIREVLNRNRIEPGKLVVMVGDTKYDMKGASETGISKIAVTFGFGKQEDMLLYNPDFFVDNIEELHEILVS